MENNTERAKEHFVHVRRVNNIGSGLAALLMIMACIFLYMGLVGWFIFLLPTSVFTATATTIYVRIMLKKVYTL
jgi:hypothetical protein